MPDGIVIEYTQSIVYDEEGQPQEKLAVSVRLTCEAFSSGWIRRNFGNHPYDLLVLAAIACHARPLHTGDLERLPDLRYLIRRTDTNLLYSLVTDVELADELGIAQRTIFDAIDRLANLGLIRVCDTGRPRVILIAPAE